MNGSSVNELTGFSRALTALVKEAASGVVAVKSAAYRVTSGIKLKNDLIAVANHALRREGSVPVQSADGNEVRATVLGREAGIDLAILKAEGLSGGVLESANAESLEAGSLTLIVGMTADVGATASLGVLGAAGPGRKMWRGGALDRFLRLDVNLYPSQAGAAAVTADGKLIGMATPALSRHSTIAVPMTTIDRIARELLEQGRIRRGYLGIGVQPVGLPDELRSTLKDVKNRGLIILSVEPESPAHEAGLQLGDILVLFNGAGMGDIDELHDALRGDIVGREIRAVVLRGGKPVEVELKVRERSQSRG
ncbi:MAG TPA: S1C family serine protease [Bryobacteraceae bacterium]|jgi:S1-C subfamily serine protease|nr:S1C family serine protease [Bryobacteraceae bacterium]